MPRVIVVPNQKHCSEPLLFLFTPIPERGWPFVLLMPSMHLDIVEMIPFVFSSTLDRDVARIFRTRVCQDAFSLPLTFFLET